MDTRRAVLGLWASATVGCVVALAGCGGPEPPGPPQPPAVEVETPVRRDVTLYYRYTGNLRSVNEVEVRARVAGTLEAMHFEPSTRVEAGAKLFTIETEPYDIAVRAAEAAVKTAEAAVELATLEKNQIQEAFDQQAANERELQKFITALRTAEAEKLAADAALEDAKLQRSYADVTSPIAGRVGREMVDVGTLVGVSEPTLLTTVVQMDPIHVYFDVSSSIVEEYLNRGLTGRVREEAERDDVPPPVVEVARASDPPGTFPFVGTLDFVEPTVDTGTATLEVRGVLPNDEARLFPGLFVRARVPYDTIADAVLVREDALGTDLSGKFVLVVGEGNVVEQRAVTLGDRTEDGFVVVTEGLTGDERYVTVGIQHARPGEAVEIRESQGPSEGTSGGGGDTSGGGA